ncbi:MAG: hypothetical protein KAG20_08795 [Cocleimonas sp.]|nr:hypothetical protein [Cocleimonas sp.]
MSSQELQPDQTPHSHWKRRIDTPAPTEASHNYLREKILAEDRRKRHTLLFSFGFFMALVIFFIVMLSLKSNLLRDSILVNNIDLLSNNEEIDFYNKMEFYQWLDLSAAEKSQ